MRTTTMRTHAGLRRLVPALAAAAIASLGLAWPVHADSSDEPFRTAYLDKFKGKKIAFVPVAAGVDLVQGWMGELKRELDPLGVSVDIRDPNYDTSAGAQAFTSLINEKPAVILVQNPDVSSYTRLIQRAERAGIPVVQINMSTVYDSTSYVGADWAQIGQIGAQAMVKACQGKSGKVAVIQGALSAATSAYQMKAIRDELAKHPEMSIVSDQPADWDPTKAKAIMQTVLRQHPDLCAAFGFWDGMDLGTAAAIEEAGLQGKVFLATSGGGEQHNACDKVESGVFDLNISYDVPNQGAQLAGVVKWIISSDIKPGDTKGKAYTTPVLIDKSNAGLPTTCWKIGK